MIRAVVLSILSLIVTTLGSIDGPRLVDLKRENFAGQKDVLFVGVFKPSVEQIEAASSDTIESYSIVINYLKYSEEFLKTFNIYPGYVDCVFLASYSIQLKTSYCEDANSFPTSVLLFSIKSYVGMIDLRALSSPELLQINILERRISLKYDLTHLHEPESLERQLGEITKQDFCKQDIIFLKMHPRPNDLEYRRILEVIYGNSKQNRFVFVQNEDTSIKLLKKLDITNENVTIVHMLCKTRCATDRRRDSVPLCDHDSLQGELSASLLVKTLLKHEQNLKNLESMILPDQALMILFYDQSRAENREKVDQLENTFENLPSQNVLFKSFDEKNNQASDTELSGPVIAAYVPRLSRSMSPVKHLNEIQMETIKLVYDRMSSYLKFKLAQDEAFRVANEPNDVDDELLTLPEDELALIEAKSRLKADLIELSQENFALSLANKPFVLVFFYLPWERRCVVDSLRLVDLARKWTEPEGLRVFAQMDCFENSRICSNKLNINDFPAYHIYSRGELVRVLSYLPDDLAIAKMANLYSAENPLKPANRKELEKFITFESYSITLDTSSLGAVDDETRFVLNINETHDLTRESTQKVLFAHVDCQESVECVCSPQPCVVGLKKTSVLGKQFRMNQTIRLKEEDSLTIFVDQFVRPILNDFNDESRIARFERSEYGLLMFVSHDDQKFEEGLTDLYRLAEANWNQQDIFFSVLDVSDPVETHSNLLLEYTSSLETPSVVALRSNKRLEIYLPKCGLENEACFNEWLSDLRSGKLEPARSIEPASFLPNVPPYDYKALIYPENARARQQNDLKTPELSENRPAHDYIIETPSLLSKARINDEL